MLQRLSVKPDHSGKIEVQGEVNNGCFAVASGYTKRALMIQGMEHDYHKIETGKEQPGQIELRHIASLYQWLLHCQS